VEFTEHNVLLESSIWIKKASRNEVCRFTRRTLEGSRDFVSHCGPRVVLCSRKEKARNKVKMRRHDPRSGAWSYVLSCLCGYVSAQKIDYRGASRTRSPYGNFWSLAASRPGKRKRDTDYRDAGGEGSSSSHQL